MKMSFSKQKPKLFYYRNYFNDEHFRNDLMYVFNKQGLNNRSCSELEDLTIATLNIHAPMNRRIEPYANLVRSKLPITFLKLKIIDNKNH